MLRRVIAFAAVLMAGAIFLGAANTARAETTYAYRTVTKVKNEWAVRDFWRTRYEHRVHRMAYVTVVKRVSLSMSWTAFIIGRSLWSDTRACT